ncbi:YdcF family protein [Corynebacterium nuruki]|uniref:YdcF family protein n=1 Tax=Corynebacterium nuruki TaxID=1032851 RepID=A0A3D4T180_9CORY|nr:YdcF family protein [Corynebacterium nuruki]HCT14510.1 YdcF family protein [Corynebacterium nuruki]
MTGVWIFGTVTVLLAVLTVWRIVREPRRVLHGLLLVATLVSLWLTLLAATWDGDGAGDAPALLFYGTIVVGLLLILGTGLFLIVNGLIVVHREGLGLSTLVPAVFGLLLVGIIVGLVTVVLFVGRGSDGHPWLGDLLVLVVLPLCAVPVGMLLVNLVGFILYSVLYGRIGRTTGADAVIVLGAGLDGDTVTPLLAARVDRGIRAWRDLAASGRSPLLVLSGGQGADEVVPEAVAMAGYAADRGMPREAMVLEDASTTTQENLVNSRELLAGRGATGRVVVVTSNYHAMRAASLTEELGIPATVVGARTASYFVPAGFLREFVAVVNRYRRRLLIVWLSLSALWLLLAGALLVIANAGQ